ncbi:single-stranded DNA-binding protein [Gardnerella sp. KA00771]|uniref:single-stranded DNA-binding protein n=1 Tax=Gardnerella TaxID=2701 RepID=UPI000C9AB9E0|nr:single-stranded DNA-binding protein [Gardnerella swidsinskii]MDK8691991.1 single-stranded DNA-binding protein [Gardnerella swidsinskii]PMC44599.1 single-stranded DNA-binding protein [Gardnerella vaginalis]
MAGETIITVVGNLTSDPELRALSNGASVASFTIASTPRTFNRNTNQFEDGPALFMRCSAWRDLAEHCANSLSKGTRVIAQGRLSQRSYQAQDGSNRTVVELTVDEIGPSLRYATAQVNRQSSSTGFAGGSRASNAAGAGYAGGANYAASQTASQHSANSSAADPWSAAAPTNDSFSTFGANSDFGGDSEEPEF